ncbi:MAG: 50S ribosomal protein P1 [Candidatus Woesearchaeota archaeon]|nr:50S ribosomal protein P1 [Candidatus Woesearchaeota archaeon]
MEYVYAAMLIHKAGGKINEASLKKVLEAAGVKADETRVRALVAALEGVNIDEAIKKSAVMQSAAPAAVEAKAEKKEEKSAEDEKKSEEQAAAGLGALFG